MYEYIEKLLIVLLSKKQIESGRHEIRTLIFCCKPLLILPKKHQLNC